MQQNWALSATCSINPEELLGPVSNQSGEAGSVTSVFTSGGEIPPGQYIRDSILCRVYTGFEQGH